MGSYLVVVSCYAYAKSTCLNTCVFICYIYSYVHSIHCNQVYSLYSSYFWNGFHDDDDDDDEDFISRREHIKVNTHL